MKAYHQLNKEERYQLEKQLQEGKTPDQIALSIGFHRSSIYREIKRNKLLSGIYSAREAWRKTISRRARQDFAPVIKIKDWVEERILDSLAKAWSPEQICGRLKLERNFSLSPEAIYKYILKDKKYGGTLYKCLRRQGRRRRMRKKSRFLKEWEPRRSIDTRPVEANERSEVGHWERDSMVSANHLGGLLVHTDRKSRLTLLDRVTDLTSQQALEKSAARFNDSSCLPIESITNDNGSEFAKHKELETLLNVNVYFARPYAPWQRGSNENAIGLIRQFIPKGSDVNLISDERIKAIEDTINNRPRKIFGYRTSIEVMTQKNSELCTTARHWKYEEEGLERVNQEASVISA